MKDASFLGVRGFLTIDEAPVAEQHGLPWLERTVQPFAKALRGWRDVTRDAAHPPLAAQFRIDLRTAVRWISSRAPSRLVEPTENAVVGGVSISFRIWELLVLTVVLQIGMLPLMARDFHRVALSAPVVNLVAVPLTGAVVPLGFLTLGSAFLFPALGRVLALPLGWLTLLLIRSVDWFAHFPRWSYRIPRPPLWLMMTFFVLAVLLCLALRFANVWQGYVAKSLCAGLAGCSLLIALFPFAPKWSPGKLELTVLDVGQGDSLLVVSPYGRVMLIDGGGSFGGFSEQEELSGIDPGEDAVSPYLWSRGFQKLDFVVLTHVHQDHLGGLLAVVENFRVGELWLGREVSIPKLARLEQLASSRGTVIKHEVRGHTFDWDGVKGQVLWPDTLASDAALAAKNDDSLVLRLQFGERAMLLPGDAEKDAEREILAKNNAMGMRADILKVGHHGSKNSTMPDFLTAVKPGVAIISAGEDNPLRPSKYGAATTPGHSANPRLAYRPRWSRPPVDRR